MSGGNTVAEGSNHDLSCDYSGTLPSSGVTYTWSKSTGAISGATSATYTLTSIAFADADSYTCTVSVNSVASDSSPGYQVSGVFLSVMESLCVIRESYDRGSFAIALWSYSCNKMILLYAQSAHVA